MSPVKLRGRERSARIALVWLGVAISGVFAYYAVRDIQPGRVWDGLRGSNYWWLAPALALLAAGVAVRALRWRFLFPAETRPPYRAVLDASVLGQFFNSVLPARAGEAARIVALNQRAGTSRAEIVATVVIERVFDVLGLLVLLFACLPWLPHVSWVRAAAMLAVAVGAGTMVVIVVLLRFGERPVRLLLRPLSRLPLMTVQRTEQLTRNLVRGAVSLRELRSGGFAFFLTVVSWVILGLSAWVLMLGFGFGLSPLAGVLALVATGLSMIIPSSPGAVGVFEAAVLVALNAYGVPKGDALSYALVLHAVNFFPYIAAGAVVLRWHTMSLRQQPA